MDFLQMSVSGAVLILAVTVIRAVALHRLPKETFRVLWGVVLARLLVPVALPSPLSVYALLAEQTSAPAPEVLLASAPAAGLGAAAPSSSVSPWTVVWLAGALVLGLGFTLVYRRGCREFQTSLPAESPALRRWLDAHPLLRPLAIRQSSRVSTPLTYGIARPVILLPQTTDWADETALDYVLTHEYIHIRRFDAAAKLVLTAALCLHWPNPLVWVMYVLANRDLELSCDERVLRRFGESARGAYARVLVQLEETRTRGFPLSSGFGAHATEERIVAIMKTKKLTRISLLAAVLLVAATTAAFATSAPAAAEDDPFITAAHGYTGEVGQASYSSFIDGGTLDADAAGETSPEVVWWTYEEYKAWLEDEKEQLRQSIGQTLEINGKEVVWTQELVDETIAMYEEFLQGLKEGKMFSKTVDGRQDLMLGYDPSWSVRSQTYMVSVPLRDGQERIFGPYETAQELWDAARPFCLEQVQLGNLEQSQCDAILSQVERDLA